MSVIKRRPGEPKRSGSGRDRMSIFLDAAQHFVLDLNQISRIEELLADEQLLGHGLRARVECSVLAKGLEFGGVRWAFGHRRLQIFSMGKLRAGVRTERRNLICEIMV